MSKKLLVVALAATIGAAGCANMSETQSQTAKGAGIGAIAGAVLGAAVDGRSGAAKGAVLGAGAGAIGGYAWSQKMEEQKRQMEQATQGTGVGVSQTADNRLKLDVPSDVSFDTGRADIKSNLRPILDRFAQSLNANPGTTVNIIGHTDSTGSDSVNNPLSYNRADSVRSYLVARGVDARRIAVEGRGSREPVANNATADGRAMNRRVEIFVAQPAQG
ncbi:OmpA family protein [Quisquiliibacterium transsilvanicum]|nr:OmpA family protein [Quisquiliibacterium transsilvanicum]